MLRIFFAVCITFSFLPLFASNYSIKNYNTEIQLNDDSSLDVTENISMNLSESRHFIDLEIPYRMTIQREWRSTRDLLLKKPILFGNSFRILISGVQVKGRPFQVSRHDGSVVVRIGDLKRKLEGDIFLTVSYKVFGAVLFYESDEELYWEIIRSQWPCVIESTDFRVIMPFKKNADKIGSFVYSGTYGSDSFPPESSIRDGVLSGSFAKPLQPHKSLSLVLRFPQSYLSSNEMDFFHSLQLWLMNDFMLLFPIGMFFILFVSVFASWLKSLKLRRNYLHSSSVFPEDITPSEVGVVLDGKAEESHLILLIPYWASRGIVTIEEIPSTHGTDKPDWRIDKKKELPASSKPFETALFKEIFRQSDGVKLSMLEGKFYVTLAKAKAELVAYMNEKNGDPTFFLSYASVVLAFILLLSGAILLMITEWPLVYISSFAASAFVLLLFGKLTPLNTRKSNILKYIIRHLGKVIYSKNQSKIQRMIKKEPSLYSVAVPYAILMGQLRNWSILFNKMDVKLPEWYLSQDKIDSYEDFSDRLLRLLDQIKSSFQMIPPVKSRTEAGSGKGLEKR